MKDNRGPTGGSRYAKKHGVRRDPRELEIERSRPETARVHRRDRLRVPVVRRPK